MLTLYEFTSLILSGNFRYAPDEQKFRNADSLTNLSKLY